MKLFFCPVCYDIRKPLYVKTECVCGLSYGWYKGNAYHSVFGGKAIPIELESDSLDKALQRNCETKRDTVFMAFVIGQECSTVERIE